MRKLAEEAISCLKGFGFEVERRMDYADRIEVRLRAIRWDVMGSKYFLHPILWVGKGCLESHPEGTEGFKAFSDKQKEVEIAFRRMGFNVYRIIMGGWKLRVLVIDDKVNDLSAHLRFDEV